MFIELNQCARFHTFFNLQVTNIIINKDLKGSEAFLCKINYIFINTYLLYLSFIIPSI